MKFKEIVKKYGKIALATALTVGSVAGGITLGNSQTVSAASEENFFVVSDSELTDSNTTTLMISKNQNYSALYVNVSINVLSGSISGYNNRLYVVENVDHNFDLSVIGYDDVLTGFNYFSGTETTVSSGGTFDLRFVFMNSSYASVNTDYTIFSAQTFNVRNIMNLLKIIVDNDYVVSEDFQVGEASLLYDKIINAYASENSNGTRDIYRAESGTLLDFNVVINGIICDNNLVTADDRHLKIVDVDPITLFANGSYTQEDLENASNEAYNKGLADADVTVNDAEVIEQYIADNNMKTETEYNAYGESQFQAGADSIDQDAIREESFSAGAESVDITSDNQEYADQYIEDNNYHTDEDYLKYGESQFQAGADSIDQDAIREESFSAGAESVDITSDNQEYADQYIKDNNYHTNDDYLKYGEEQFVKGENSVDSTSDNQQAIEDYIEDNELKSQEEFEAYGQEQYDAGFEDNGFWKQVGRLFSNMGALFVNAFNALKFWD